MKNRGINAVDYYHSSEIVRVVIDKLNAGVGRESFADIADYLLGRSEQRDPFWLFYKKTKKQFAYFNQKW